MTDYTNRLQLPLLTAGQAQKEIAHNEALILADMMIQPVVEAIGLDTPPASPTPGQCWIVGGSPTGDWAGKAKYLASWSAGGWRFIAPKPGFSARHKTHGKSAVFSDGSWQVGIIDATELRINGDVVVKSRQAGIAGPSGGTAIDDESRVAIEAILQCLRTHGLIAA